MIGGLKRLSATVLLAATLFVPGTLLAEKKVMVITSNSQVEKYREAEEAFKKSLGRPVTELDMGDESWTPKKLKNYLYDEYPDLVYAIGAKAYQMANALIGEKTIVFSSAVNWHRLPGVEKRYGVSNELHSGMQLMLLRHVFPKVETIGLLYSGEYSRELMEEVKKNAELSGHKIKAVRVDDAGELLARGERALDGADAFMLFSDPVLLKDRERFEELMVLAREKKVPVVGFFDALARAGGSLVVAVDSPTTGRQAAEIVSRLSEGEAPEKPVRYPAGSRIIVNLKQLRALGVTVNEQALAGANEIIE